MPVAEPNLEVAWVDRLERPSLSRIRREVGHSAYEIGDGEVYFEADVPGITWLGSSSRWRLKLRDLHRETTRLTTTVPFGDFRPVRSRVSELLDSFVTLVSTVKFLGMGRAPCHASSVARDGHAVIFFGYGGTGKTTAAMASIKLGYEYMGDDYTIVDADGGVYSYPIWNLPHPLRGNGGFARYLFARPNVVRDRVTVCEHASVGPIFLLERGPEHVEELPADEASRRILLMNLAEMSRLWSNPVSRILDTYAYFFPQFDVANLLASYRQRLVALVNHADACYLVRSSSADFRSLERLLAR